MVVIPEYPIEIPTTKNQKPFIKLANRNPRQAKIEEIFDIKDLP